MANQWFKFYGADYLSDQKIDRLNPIERSCWITLLCLASTNDSGEIRHLTVQTLLNKSGVQYDPYHPESWEDVLGIFEKFEMLDMIERIDVGTIIIKNWSKRQETALTGYERVKKYRENKKKLKNDNEMITSDNDNDNVRIEENRIEENRIDTNEQLFENFWKEYPEKKGKGKAKQSWNKLSAKEKKECIEIIKKQVEFYHFRNKRGEDFIPHPATWLNQRRWEDEIKTKESELQLITFDK